VEGFLGYVYESARYYPGNNVHRKSGQLWVRKHEETAQAGFVLRLYHRCSGENVGVAEVDHGLPGAGESRYTL
jgi:hypothetical protein